MTDITVIAAIRSSSVSVVTIVEGAVVKKNEGFDQGNRRSLGKKPMGSKGDLVVSQAQLIEDGVVEVD